MDARVEQRLERSKTSLSSDRHKAGNPEQYNVRYNLLSTHQMRNGCTYHDQSEA